MHESEAPTHLPGTPASPWMQLPWASEVRPGILQCYHFSAGDSTTGPIGYCAAVLATSPEEAVETMRERLPESCRAAGPQRGVLPGNEYIEVYFNALAVTFDDIDEVNTAPGAGAQDGAE